jgi:predicted transcriptional regulator of viral defense system
MPRGARDRVLQLARERGVMRPRDVVGLGVAPVVLTRLVRERALERVARGVYVLPGEGLASGSALGVVATRVPGCVVCLGSALQVHELSTWVAPEVWIAVASHRRPPKVDWPPLHVVYVKPELLELGVEVRVVDGVPVRVTGPARTVADCFKWRGTVGIDVAVEALRAFVERGGSRDELHRISERLRVARVMRPYLEALS